MNVFSNPISDLQLTEKIEIDDKQTSIKYGDVFFTTSSETPEEVGMSSVWLGKSENTYLNSFCFGFRLNQELNPYFLAYLLRSETFRKKIVILAQGISRYNISKKKVMELTITYPKSKEQKEIGSFLRKIDTLITLHQREQSNMKGLNH